MSEIQVKNLKKTYVWGEEKIQVLKGISLNIEKQSFVSIVGESGSGKTTLLNLLGGLDHPDEGELWIEGRNIASFNEDEISSFRNQKMGFIFQFYNLLQDFTVLENAMLPHYLATRSKKKAMKKGKDLLIRLGLGHRLDYYPSRLSGGEQQRVAIARALVNEPKIIFADEPTGNLDKDNCDRVMNLLMEMRKDYGFTMVMVTHDLEIAKLSDRLIRLSYGVVVD